MDEQGGENIRRSVLRRLRAKRGRDFAIRMTPMIDMVFLLLIFFLVTSNFRPPEKFLPMQLAPVQAQGRGFGKVVSLRINIFAVPDGCEVQIGENQTVLIGEATAGADLAALADAISDIMRRQKRNRDDPVEIACEADVQWQYWAKIYNVLFGMGIEDITVCKTE